MVHGVRAHVPPILLLLPRAEFVNPNPSSAFNNSYEGIPSPKQCLLQQRRTRPKEEDAWRPASTIAFGTQRATTKFPRGSWLVARSSEEGGTRGIRQRFRECLSEVPQPLKAGGLISVSVGLAAQNVRSRNDCKLSEWLTVARNFSDVS